MSMITCKERSASKCASNSKLPSPGSMDTASRNVYAVSRCKDVKKDGWPDLNDKGKRKEGSEAFLRLIRSAERAQIRRGKKEGREGGT